MPPVAETSTVVEPPKQFMVPGVEEADSAVGSESVPPVMDEHPLASVTVYEYAPAVLVKEPTPVYGVVPPVAKTVTVVEPPLQAIVPAVEDAESAAAGWVMFAVAVAEHPPLSVTVHT